MNGPACRLNVAEFDATIANVVGAVRSLVDVESITLTPPAGGLLLRITVHVVDADGVTAAGLQNREEIITGDVSGTVVLAELPL